MLCLQMYSISCHVLPYTSEVLWQIQLLFILYTARVHIPKGVIPKYKSFWSDLLTKLKNDTGKARKKELPKEPKDIQAWREKAGIVKMGIVSANK